jgi:type IV secretion/conjugal transfer VirB4 family ATPase
MFNLAEYRQKPDRLSDLLPWALLVAPGVVLNKDGSFQKTFRFRGPDLASAVEEELLIIASRINNTFKRLAGGWAIFAEAQRIRSQSYPESVFPDLISLMIDVERKLFFSEGNHYENNYYLTLLYLPPRDNVSLLAEYLIQRSEQKGRSTYRSHLKTFQTEVDRIYSLFAELMVEAEALNDTETMTYLHNCISEHRHPVKAPEVPLYLDAILADTPLLGGLEPKLGQEHLRVLSILGFPGASIPGILDNLNLLNFEYRWMTRYLPLDKTDAQKELKQYRKQWFASRQGAVQMIKEAFTGSRSAMVNNDALTRSSDADEALQELDADYVNYGYFTATVTVWDRDPKMVEKKVNAVEKTINNLGFTAINETINAVDAWLGSLPGHTRANVRRPLFNSLNLSHIFPLSAIWAGPERNKHFNAPVLMHTQTPDQTPFRFNLHIGDVGHAMIVGPTGMGKSTLLMLMATQFRRYPRAQVYIFDKDASSKVLTAGVGGDFYELADEKEGRLSFQPLAHIDDERERSWAAEWIYNFLRAENVEINPNVKKTVWIALGSLAQAPVEQRTITGLWGLIMNNQLKAALEPATLNGALGRLFDATTDTLDYGRWQVFEMAKLMNTPAAVGPTLDYLFHKIEQRFNGEPTILDIDEGWTFLENSSFGPKIEEWLRTLRKANVSVIFATQALGEIYQSPFAQTIMEVCQTKIYLPNPNAISHDIAPIYESFGLNATERRIIAEMTPKRQYYYKSILGSRLFELALGPIALAYCAASSKADRNMVDEILRSKGKDSFNEEWLRYKKLPETADTYREFMQGFGSQRD